MKLTHVLALILKKNNIKNVFGLQGGAVVHIFDSLEKYKFNVTYTPHEQTASLAAVANAKVNENIGCVVVTTGPACTNAMTGLLAAWQDSIPCIFISGQSRSNHTSYNKKVRQTGTQEVNICDIVKPITKYASFVKNKNNFQEELTKALSIAISGRPGPVWLDIPLDIQWSEIDYNKKYKVSKILQNNLVSNSKMDNFLKLCKNSKKPLILMGYGCRLSDPKIANIKYFISKNKIPFVSTWNTKDFFPSNHKLNLGTIGMSGQRGANKAMFEADLIICLGSHLPIPHTTTLYKNYAPRSKKIIVNIDKDQLKNLNVKFDLKICADTKQFLFKIKNKKLFNRLSWQNLEHLKQINWVNPKKTKKINSDFFINKLSNALPPNSCIVVDGGGTALYSGFQSTIVKANQRIICSSAISSMGTGLAESIGCYKSGKFKKIVCIIGDGSLLMNIQDLETIKQYKMNISIILVNNNGYLAIRHTQKEFLKGRYYGTNPKGNLTMPNFESVSKAFGLSYLKVKKYNQVKQAINRIMKYKFPIVCEIITSKTQSSLFKQGYKKLDNGQFAPQPLNEMHPFFTKSVSNTNN
jgi:acetolactate synthase-1/2/3 large subunit